MKEPELKPCPFCGGEARIIVVEKGVHSIIECTTHYCGFMRHSFNNGDTDEHAALRLTTAWNSRAINAEKQIEAEWVKIGVGITERVVCSNCKSEKGSFMSPPFCNQCGAKMKGGVE